MARGQKKSCSVGGPPTETIPTLRDVLVVVRSLVTLNRLVDVLQAISADSRLAVKFVIDEGSKFAGNLERHLEELDMDVVTWAQAKKSRWDLVIAAHVNRGLRKLRGPLVAVAHGAGYSRIVPWATGSNSAPVGLARGQVTWRGKAIPAAIGLSHEDQREQLLAVCPEAVDRAFVMGDPTFDRLRANVHRRDHFRKLLNVGERRLVVVSSTWGRHSSLAKHQNLALRLMAQLPADSWQVVMVLHPNVSLGGSSGWEIETQFADALESGLVIIPPAKGWQAALIAGDVITGDHGSVSFYGAALGCPFLLTATGLDELAPSSPRVLLSRTADRLDVNGDLLAQIESAIRRHDPGRITAITDMTLGRQGESLVLLRRKLYELVRLEPPPRRARIRPLPDPEPAPSWIPTAYLVAAHVHPINDRSAWVELNRFPALLGEHRGSKAPEELFSIVDDTEVDHGHRQSAEIMVHGLPMSEEHAAQWIKDIRRECLGAALVAVGTGSGCLLHRYDGHLYRATVSPVRGADPAGPDPLVAAAALYGWIVGMRPVPRRGVTLHVRIGTAESVIKVVPITYLARPP